CPYGNYIYTATETYGVQIIDVSDPNNLSLANILYTGGEANYLAILDNWLYVTLGVAGLGVYDITDAVNPHLELNWNTLGGNAGGIYVYPNGDYLAFADFSNGVQVLDLTFPWIPTYHFDIDNDTLLATDVGGGEGFGICTDYLTGILSFNMNGEVIDVMPVDYSYSLEVDYPYCYVAKLDTGIQIINCAQPGNLSTAAYVPDSGKVGSVSAFNGIAYVAAQKGGLFVLDVNDPWNPEIIDALPSESSTTSCVLSENNQYLFTTEFSSGINIYSLSDPLHPLLVNTISIEPDTGAGWLLRHDNIYYLTMWYGKLNAYDLSDPMSPELVGEQTFGDYFGGLAFFDNGDHVFIIDGNEGVSVYTVISPDSFEYEYDLEFFDEGAQIAIKDNYAYFADFNYGLYVCDVTNYAYIFKVDSLPSQCGANSITVLNDNYISMCDWTEGFAIVDVSDPSNIFEVERMQTPAIAWSIFYIDNILYVCDKYDLIICDLFDNVGIENREFPEIPSDISLLSPAYPNPFNSSTRLKFKVPETVRVKLGLFNLKGERVMELANEVLSPGEYSRKVDSDLLSSGIYYARLECANRSFVQKIALVK
nr:T9SS type A sorting domain-containing protein [Candidatus Neomarinimicrobiota bacterium]